MKYLTPDHQKACDSTMQELAIPGEAGDLEPTVHDEYVCIVHAMPWYSLRNYMCVTTDTVPATCGIAARDLEPVPVF